MTQDCHRGPATVLLGEGELLAAVYGVVAPIVEAARKRHGGPLPSMRTAEFLDADPSVQLACLLVLAEAWIAEDPRQAELRRLREVSNDVHGEDGELWRDLADHAHTAPVRGPRNPVRCDRCHHRLAGTEAAA